MVDKSYLEFEEKRQEILERLDRIEDREFSEPRDFDDDAAAQAKDRDEQPPPRIRRPGGECAW